jgi:hypothetical protein
METENTIDKHRKMVLRLGKPGEAILNSLTPFDCNLTHMGGCLMGEASELYDSITDAPSGELLEELGDFAFYLVAVRAIYKQNWNGIVGPVANPVTNAVELMRLGGHFWDVVKRIVIYRKYQTVPDSKYEGQSIVQVSISLLDQMELRFNAIITHYDYTLDEVLEANWDKLANTDTGRYSSGSYSDQQAQDRKDKAKG